MLRAKSFAGLKNRGAFALGRLEGRTIMAEMSEKFREMGIEVYVAEE
jgi:hypothetical protein